MTVVDWALAARIARTVGGSAPPSAPPEGLEAIAAAAGDQIATATGLVPSEPLPPVEWVGRGTWIDANLATMQVTLGPAIERAAGRSPQPFAATASALLAAEIGGLLGMLSRRVLGQYELRLTEPEAPGRLLLVAPNLDAAARDLQADRRELVTWVTLHEVTHAVQFAGVPWLRPHLGEQFEQLLGMLDVRPDPRALLRLNGADLRGAVDRFREGGLVLGVMGPERRALIDRVQATMALVEGHAEWAMDASGEDVLGDVSALRTAMSRRRADRSPVLKVLDRLLGFELKLRQYEIGRSFCDAVVAARGVEGLLDAWSSPQAAPTQAELAAPEGWLARRRPAAA